MLCLYHGPSHGVLRACLPRNIKRGYPDWLKTHFTHDSQINFLDNFPCLFLDVNGEGSENLAARQLATDFCFEFVKQPTQYSVGFLGVQFSLWLFKDFRGICKLMTGFLIDGSNRMVGTQCLH